MCGRYAFSEVERISDRFHTNNHVANLLPRYNVVPGSRMPVITRKQTNSAEVMKWGLVPHWAKDVSIGYKMINARAETVADKPSFKQPFLTQRCLVPASGFYEWQKQNGKQPYYFHLKNQTLFSFAGLYDEWNDAEGKPLKTYTIITTRANDIMAPVHHRMPVILRQDHEAVWLSSDTKPQILASLLQPLPSQLFEAYPVSSAVNSPKQDSPQLINAL
jgi:putative SOS response-associated peptidase YedK